MGGWRDGWMAGWVGGGMGGWMGERVGYININDMYNNDVGKGGLLAHTSQTHTLPARMLFA